ncbi:MAG: hypothetical protein LUD15_03980, partial [Bacteroides sp.]|nr:hypothetical protein [Bacteroides sp.]
LVNRWIEEYKRANLQAGIDFVTEHSAGEADLTLIAHPFSPENGAKREDIIYTGRYALLPVTHKENPLLSEVGKKGLSKKEFRKIFFIEDMLEESESKEKYDVTVYTRNNRAGTTIILAHYFGLQPANLKGKKIAGDDIFLLSAIRKDTKGVTFNSLNYLFDVESRTLNPEIALLPLAVKSQHKEVLNAENMDQVIELLETTTLDVIPVEHFGFVLSDLQKLDKEVLDFVKWVVEEGQQYNHQAGFLSLENRLVAEQLRRLSERSFVVMK